MRALRRLRQGREKCVMYDEEWMVKAGAWAGLGVLLAIGAILGIIAIIGILLSGWLF